MGLLTNVILRGDNRVVLKTIPDNSVDSIVTDPPAGIEVLGLDWDNPAKFGTTFQSHGYSDGKERLSAPAQKLSTRNPQLQEVP